MGTFGVIVGILHYAGFYIQFSTSSRQGGHTEVENHISGNALFTEVPHDITTQSGQDVEMACSFRGVGSPSYSLEIQWWYIRNHKEWTDKQAWMTNQVTYCESEGWGFETGGKKVFPQEDISKDATKISVVKVAGSNISHKLRLSSVKPSDEGTYECRVIDFSDRKARYHKVRAYLQVEPEQDVTLRHPGANPHPQDAQSELPKHPPGHSHHKGGRELKKRSVNSGNGCADSGVL